MIPDEAVEVAVEYMREREPYPVHIPEHLLDKVKAVTFNER